MDKRLEDILEIDELFGLVSALALAQNVSESEITTQDIRNVCADCGWNDPPLILIFDDLWPMKNFF